MFWFASSLASKVRLPNSSIRLVPTRFYWRRNALSQDIKVVSPCTKYKTVLGEALCNEGRNVLATAGEVNISDIVDGVQLAIVKVSKNLSSGAQMISTYKEIAQVATTSAYGDRKIGLVIAHAMKEVGKKLDRIFISSQTTGEPHIELEFLLGMTLSEGYASSCFVTNKKKKICVLQRPYTFIYGGKLSDFDLITKLLSDTYSRRAMLIVAKDFANDVLNAIISRKVIYGAKVCAIRVLEDDYMQFLASVSRTRVLEEKPVTTVFEIGICDKVLVSENNTVFLKDGNSMSATREFLTHTRKLLRLTSKNIKREDRKWSYADLKVGRARTINMGQMKNIVTHALNAVKDAMDEGIVPGGGIGLLNASKELDKVQTTNHGQKIGVQIMQNALKMSVRTLASTAAVEGLDVDNLLQQDNPDLAYDAAKNVLEFGIVDPLKVVRTAVSRATSMFIKKLLYGKLHKDESENNEDERELDEDESLLDEESELDEDRSDLDVNESRQDNSENKVGTI
ncbi:hypothetical protein AB3S75_000006 [Citrus x aurantiifolia]